MKRLRIGVVIVIINTLPLAGLAQVVINGLMRPAGIDSDSSGRIYVTDYFKGWIFCFSEKGNLLHYFGSMGQRDDQLWMPASIAIDKKTGNIYITDQANQRIQVFDKNEKHLFHFGSKGSGPGQFINPSGIRISPSGDEIYVVDSGNSRIVIFSKEGIFKKSVGSYGHGKGEFYFPQALAFSPSGNIYIADQYNHRIQVFSKDWKYLSQFGEKGSGNGQFSYPAGIAVDSRGNIYVTDLHNARVEVFSKKHEFIRSIGSFGYNAGQFSEPTEVVILNDKMYVSDHSRVQEINGLDEQHLLFDPLPPKKSDDGPFILSAHSDTKVPIRYSSSDTSIIKITGDQARIVGHGTVVVTASQEGTVNYAPVSSRQMIIIDPIWKAWWFLVLITFWISVVAYVVSAQYVKSVKKKAKDRLETESRINKLQMTALKSQMSPHFIFNCLNTINSYILKSNSELASEYLARFAKLIRLVLENSEETIIPLKSELEMIDMYLSLEVIRFDKKIDYEIINDGVDTDFEIPSMSLQPFIENAIWHGLLHKLGPGKIVVQVTPHGKGIKCIVEDDGIGRQNAAKLRTNPRKSYGLSNTSERLKLLNKSCEIHIVDLKTNTNAPAGTRVEIIFKAYNLRNLEA